VKSVISFANHKGGVGKTTSVVNIASVWGETGRRVLVVDLDPQGSASLHFGVRSSGREFLQAMERTVALPVLSTVARGVDLVPCGPALSAAAQKFSGFLAADLLGRCLARTRGDWEFLLIDCPPSLGILTTSALIVSRQVVVPIEANHLDLNGLHQLIETLSSVSRQDHRIRLLGIIVCRAMPRRRLHREIMADLERTFPGDLAPFIRENVALAEAPSRGQPVILYAPHSNGAEDYRLTAEWLLERVLMSRRQIGAEGS
jgi:chromosome partitioning protein